MTAKPLTFMLKDIILLLGEIFGLGVSTGSTSLCVSRERREAKLVKRCRNQDVSFDSFWIEALGLLIW